MTTPAPRQIFKTITTLGGSQGVMILCSLVRAKLIAVLLGPTATGFFAIFNNAVETIGSVTRLDLRRATVREISRVKFTPRLGIMSEAVLKTGWILGLVGGVVIVVLSPVLSRLSFGDNTYMASFAMLGVALVALSVQEGYYSVMTGRGDVRRFAISQMAGSVGGLLFSIPLFFWLGMESIVPSIIVYAIVSAAVSALMTGKINSAEKHISVSQSVRRLYPALKLGMWLTLAAFVTRLADYVFVSWLTREWTVETVGIYNAGATLTGRAAALLLAALASEFYPRISSLGVEHRAELSASVSMQIKVILTVAVPLLIVFVLTDRYFVQLLYSTDYLGAIPYLGGAAAAIPFKAASWTLAFVMLARGAGKMYLLTESISAITGLVLNIASFIHGGMAWLGYACMANEILYFVIVAAVCRRYGVIMSRGVTAGMIFGSLLILTGSLFSV